MLPVVAGVPAAAVQIVLYAVALLGVTLLLAPVAALGTVYLTVAIALGAGFVVAALRLVARPERALAVFRYSNLYLALLFGAVALDVLVAA